MLDDIPRRGHREAVNRVRPIGGRQLVGLSFESEKAVADPVGKRKQNRCAVSGGGAG